MSQIEVPYWVVEEALRAGFRFVCQQEGCEFSEEEFQNGLNERDAENRQAAADMMKAALTAALGAWVVPVGVSREHDASRPTFQDVVPNDSQEADMWAYDLIPLLTLRQEKP